MQSLWDPGQQVVPQRVIDRNAEIPGTRQEGGLGAAATHTQHIGDTQRGQLVLHTHTHARALFLLYTVITVKRTWLSVRYLTYKLIRLCVHINALIRLNNHVGNCLEHF